MASLPCPLSEIVPVVDSGLLDPNCQWLYEIELNFIFFSYSALCHWHWSGNLTWELCMHHRESRPVPPFTRQNGPSRDVSIKMSEYIFLLSLLFLTVSLSGSVVKTHLWLKITETSESNHGEKLSIIIINQLTHLFPQEKHWTELAVCSQSCPFIIYCIALYEILTDQIFPRLFFI